MRKGILSMDPEFLGTTDITNPDTDQVIQYPIMMAPTFFYLTEA